MNYAYLYMEIKFRKEYNNCNKINGKPKRTLLKIQPREEKGDGLLSS